MVDSVSSDPAPERTAAGRRAVVTGAAGFIGSHLVDALLTAGHPVVGIDSFTPYYDPATKRANLTAAAADRRFTLVRGDLAELELDQILRPGDWVFHLAAQPGVRPSWGSDFALYVRSNIQATQRLLEAARKVRGARIIFASSSSVYGDAPIPMEESGPTRPISPYGITKLAGEQLCLAYWRTFGLEAIPLRFFTVYGPRQRPDMAFHRFVEAVIDGTVLPLYGDGSQRRDFTYVADVARVLMAAAERGRPGVPVNVAGGAALSVNEALGLIERLVGRRAVTQHLSPAPGDPQVTRAATDRLRELDDSPSTGIVAGLERQVAWHLDRMESAKRLGARRSTKRSSERPPDGAVVLYSHDTYGLGHQRRNVAIAHAVLRLRPETRVVMLTGLPVADEWRLQTAVELVSMPTAVKVGVDQYCSADGGSFSELLAVRAEIVAETLLRFRPFSFLVDHAPLGMKGELTRALHLARDRLPATRVILGLRDVVDDPATVVEVWRRQGIYQALESAYDHVLVYGSADLFDVRDLYELPAPVRARTTFTGYVGKAADMELAPSAEDWPALAGPRFLVTGGGGGDASELFGAFLTAWPSIRERAGGAALLVAGPRMTAADKATHAAAISSMPAIQFVESSVRMLGLISRADVVISMGGYNTVVEALTARRPLVIMPRVSPRREQLIRARIIEQLGLARVVLPGRRAPEELSRATLAAVTAGSPTAGAWATIDLRGLERVAKALVRPSAVGGT